MSSNEGTRVMISGTKLMFPFNVFSFQKILSLNNIIILNVWRTFKINCMFKSSFAVFFFFVINLISGFILQSWKSVWWHATSDDLLMWLACVGDHVHRWWEKDYFLLRLVCICFRIEKSDFFSWWKMSHCILSRDKLGRQKHVVIWIFHFH